MKRFLLLFIILFFLANEGKCIGFLSDESDTVNCLLIGGSFSELSYSVKNISVYLYMESEKIDSSLINGNKDFAYVLKRNHKYCIQVVKEGYVTRYITIDTSLPYNVDVAPLFVFEFIMDLKRTIKGVDDYYFDFPIAQIAFDNKIEKFDYKRKYTTVLKSKMKQAENEFRLTKSR